MLPLCAPYAGRNPITSETGHPLVHRGDFIRLIRRHHVLGSCTLLSAGGGSAAICTSVSTPPHHADENTFFRVASITKTATAVLAMRLADRGIIRPDSPVSEYFECREAVSALEGITLRHLLSHASGIADPPGLEQSLVNGVPFTALLPDARKEKPGTSFRYSNLGFGLIGCVFESVLGRPVGDIFRTELFTPLDMNATLEGCRLPKDQIMPVIRILPCRKGSGLVLTELGSHPLVSPDPLRHYGHTAGSMYTDAASLLTLLQVISCHRLSFLSPEAVRDMKKEHASYGALSPTLSYGLGLLRISDPSVSAGVVYGHQGFAYGCADGAFWEEETGNILITLNGGCSEARTGRLGLANRDFLRWAFRKELPAW